MAESGRTFDVIIIGAGSVGVPTADFLSRAGLRVLVLDRRASVGQGANKAAIGGIRATHSDPAKIRIGLRSIEIFSTWADTHGDDIEWHAGGYTFAAYRNREEDILKGLLKVQRTYNLNIQWLNRGDLLDAVTGINPDGLIGGTLSPEDGTASPLRALHAFYRHAQQGGTVFRFNETVTQIPIIRGKVQGVLTDKGRFHAPIVINAAGAYARSVSSLVGLDTPVTPESHEAGVTEPVARFVEPMIVDIRPTEGSANFYFYQQHTGQIIFCITPAPAILGTDRRETSEFLPMVSRRMVQIMPRLKNVKVRRTWRGQYPMTPDGAPIVGKVREVEGFIQAVGMCGQGFMLGPGLATYLTKLVLDEIEHEDQEVFDVLSPYREFAGAEQLK